eukprot:1147143-Pelagomonas_calceolata.AAC.1
MGSIGYTWVLSDLACYGTLVEREKGDRKEVPGSNPCSRGGEKDALFGRSPWKALSLMHAAAWQA